MNNSKKSSIVYVNFAPYENAGQILDYLFETYDPVVTFCFNFHKLTKNEEPSLLKVYSHKKLLSEHRLYYIPTPESLAFLLLPIRSVIIFLQLLIHTIRIRMLYGPLETYFTVNAFTAWCGIILKKMKLVHRTVFWIWDYYPPKHPSKVVTFMRWLYWLYDKPATIHSDKIVFLNHRLAQLRQELGILNKKVTYPVVQIGTNPIAKLPAKKKSPINLVFLGVVKKSQGLDLVFDAAEQLKKQFKDIHVTVIGSGPEEEYFQARAKQTGLTTTFLGFMNDESLVDTHIRKAHIGIATYVPEVSNVSYYSDPSKIKRYISSGVPVITTNVFNFSHTITASKAGIVIEYNPKNLTPAISTIMKSYESYSKNALSLSKEYSYSKIYSEIFT